MGKSSFALWAPFSSAWQNRAFIIRLARREIEARYRGSVLGIVWAFFVPLLLVGVYTLCIFPGV
jgi:lipopolysaccharide transport system permease protein